MKMMLDASETYTVLRPHSDEQHIQISQHFMPKLARTRLAKMRKSDLNLKLPLKIGPFDAKIAEISEK